MVFPVVAGTCYFYPLVVGKALSERLGRIAFWLMFVGFNVAFLPMHITGLGGMPRRVFTYRAAQGFDVLNLVSTLGAFVLAAGFAVLLFDALWTAWKRKYAARDPWRAGTLEWLGEMPGKPWGVRSIPIVSSRYPLWDQPGLMRDVDAGRFYLADAREGKRETLVTSTIDAMPEQCLRVPGPTFLTLWAAAFTGGAFIFPVFDHYIAAGISAALALVAILAWLWTGTAQIPEKPAKEVGLGLGLPLYASGQASVGWWAMFITMIGDMTAFASLVFGYFFFWTVHDDFPPDPAAGPGVLWPSLALGLTLAAWAATVLARGLNRRDAGVGFFLAAGTAAVLAIVAAAALLAGPWLTGMDPTAHAYPATVWLLVGWTAAHIAVGVIMQLYCIARRAAGRMTAAHDIDIHNVALYWHFVAITVLVTVATIAGFPLLA